MPIIHSEMSVCHEVTNSDIGIHFNIIDFADNCEDYLASYKSKCMTQEVAVKFQN